jgi:uncharacterized membrane protein
VEDVLQVAGPPLHPLIVHAVIVLTPLTVLALLVGTFWPTARRRLGGVSSGECLHRRAGAHEVAVAVSLVDAADRRPVLVAHE